jgi:putative methionine-R-sulfoxide reductase with GAF domain
LEDNLGAKMGRRQKPRFRMVLPVSIWGTDTSGKAFHQLAYTLDISTGGARVAGVPVALNRGDIVAVRYKQRKARFHVVWTNNNQIGLQYIEGEKFIWVELPEEEFVDRVTVMETPAPPTSAEPPPPAGSSQGPREAAQETQAPQDAGSIASPAVAAESRATDGLAARLEACLAALHELDALVNSAGMVSQVAGEFHAAAGHLRNTAWAVEQWIELQQESRDSSPILESVNSERVRFATRLCRELVEDQQRLVAGVSQESREALVKAVQLLAQGLGAGDRGGLQDQSRPRLAAQRDPLALLAGLNDEIRSTPVSAEETLALIAERARSFTDADGAAIALRDEDDMVCCASAGLAPLAGVRFSMSGGLAGEAIATRQPVLCCDVEKDQRVDATLCRRLDVGSSAIVPILAGDLVVGLLQVFAGRPNAFDEASASLLQHVAEFVASLEPDLRLHPEPR